MQKILIIEDDPAIQIGIQSSLEDSGYTILSSEDGQKGFEMALEENPDLIVLDIMLPNKNGMDICKDLRLKGLNMPILMLTSKKEEIDKVLAFEFGADDYVTKPFGVRELQARIKALLRRTGPQEEDLEEVTFGDVKINFKKHEAEKNGMPVNLNAKEFQILKYFLEREGEVISRDKLLDDVWGYDAFPTTRTVDNYILSIRKSIEDDPSKPTHLVTVHTVGYKFIT